jgi:hypothetical protein
MKICPICKHKFSLWERILDKDVAHYQACIAAELRKLHLKTVAELNFKNIFNTATSNFRKKESK